MAILLYRLVAIERIYSVLLLQCYLTRYIFLSNKLCQFVCHSYVMSCENKHTQFKKDILKVKRQFLNYEKKKFSELEN